MQMIKNYQLLTKAWFLDFHLMGPSRLGLGQMFEGSEASEV